MIKSMTGFGRAEVVTKERKITIELKSVNHRYLDLSIKMPRKLNFLEGAVRNLMKTYIQRGKVDVYITYEDYTLDNGALKYNRELASEYITCLKQMQQDFDLDYDIKVSTLSRYPEVLVMEEQSVDEEALWESLEPPLREACEKFVQTRILEGRNLEKDLIGKLDSLEEKVLRVEARSPEVVNAYRTKLEAKVSELLEDTQIDDNRIAAEVILFVLVGAAVDIRYTLEAGAAAVLIILVALIFRACGVFLCMVKTNLNVKERLFCVIAYLPKATVQAPQPRETLRPAG